MQNIARYYFEHVTHFCYGELFLKINETERENRKQKTEMKKGKGLPSTVAQVLQAGPAQQTPAFSSSSRQGKGGHGASAVRTAFVALSAIQGLPRG